MTLFIFKRLFFLIIILAFLLSACDFFDRAEERIVITVGEREITEDELKKEIQLIILEMDITENDTEFSLEPIIKKVIERSLILEYGKAENILLSEEELESAIRDIKKDYPGELFQEVLIQRYIDFNEWKEGFRQDLLIKKIISVAASGIPSVSFKETKDYFESHRDQFKRQHMVMLRQIVTGSREEAEEIRKRLERGDKMEELAKKHSVTPEAEEGGVLGWVTEGQLDEPMEKVVFSLPKGKISAVFRSPYGYHIFEVLSVREEGLKELPEARPEVESTLMLQKMESFYEEWVKELKDRFPVRREKEILRDWSIKG